MQPITITSLARARNKWELPDISADAIDKIRQELQVSTAMARVLAYRAAGHDPNFLFEKDLSQLHDPFSMKGVPKAVERIKEALENKEKIFIHGDFDVDGITSAALLYRALKRLNAGPIKVEIEDRDRGHGLNSSVIQQIINEKFDLLITTDCGISDHDLIENLRAHEIDVIITDHHHVPEQTPDAVSIVNPKQSDCTYKNPDLSAVGVIFQTVAALFEVMGVGKEEANRYLDLVMLGTLGDLVPLVGNGSVENRLFVQGGIVQIAEGRGTLGLSVLIKRLSLDARRLTSGEISYVVIPKLNSANRVGDPRVSFLLLTTNDPEKADHLAQTLLDYNHDRQVAQGDLRELAEEKLREEINLDADKIIILSGKYWNPGVIGLVASDIADRFHRPTILLSKGDEFARASGRSIPEFNMIEALTAHENFFERFGGHHMAAGFSIRNERINDLKEEMCEYARNELTELHTPTYTIEAEIDPQDITLDVFDEIQRLGPFGVGNREPRFYLRDVHVDQSRVVGANGRHLKLKLNAGGMRFDSIGFSLGDASQATYNAKVVDLVVKLSKDNWNGRSRIQLELIDILSSQTD